MRSKLDMFGRIEGLYLTPEEQVMSLLEQLKTEIAALREENASLKDELDNLEDVVLKMREENAKTEAARAQAQEWLDKFQGYTADRDLEILKLKHANARLRDVLESAPEPEMEDNHFTEASGQREEWAVDEAYGRWFHGPRAEALK